MSSAAEQFWRTDRLVRLGHVRDHCLTAAAVVPAVPLLADESLRGWVMLLSAHFQGFCRDLYTEAAQTVIADLPSHCQPVSQKQYLSGLRLDTGNPTLDTLDTDFRRFDIQVKAGLGSNPALQTPKRHMSELNKWRNKAAHHGPDTLPELAVGLVTDWTDSCDALAVALDGLVYIELSAYWAETPGEVEGGPMAVERKVTPPMFKHGDRVAVKLSNFRGRVYELRGPLGPGGAQIYRVRTGRKRYQFIEVREDQLELLPAETDRQS